MFFYKKGVNLMRKFTLLLIAVLVLLPLCACEKIPPLEKDELIDILIYSQDCSGPLFRSRGIKNCDEAYALIDLLNNAKTTGEKVEKISDDVIDKRGNKDYPVNFGTTWLEIGERIYRISHDDTQIWLVDTHLGGGVELEMSDDIKKAVYAAWNYSPYFRYEGTYHVGDESIELEVVEEKESPIRISIKSLEIQKFLTADSIIALTLVSSEDIETVVDIYCIDNENDDGAPGTKLKVQLKKDEPKLVETYFRGFPFSHDLHIIVDKTSVNLKVIVD